MKQLSVFLVFIISKVNIEFECNFSDGNFIYLVSLIMKFIYNFFFLFFMLSNKIKLFRINRVEDTNSIKNNTSLIVCFCRAFSYTILFVCSMKIMKNLFFMIWYIKVVIFVVNFRKCYSKSFYLCFTLIKAFILKAYRTLNAS